MSRNILMVSMSEQSKTCQLTQSSAGKEVCQGPSPLERSYSEWRLVYLRNMLHLMLQGTMWHSAIGTGSPKPKSIIHTLNKRIDAHLLHRILRSRTTTYRPVLSNEIEMGWKAHAAGLCPQRTVTQFHKAGVDVWVNGMQGIVALNQVCRLYWGGTDTLQRIFICTRGGYLARHPGLKRIIAANMLSRWRVEMRPDSWGGNTHMRHSTNWFLFDPLVHPTRGRHWLHPSRKRKIAKADLGISGMKEKQSDCFLIFCSSPCTYSKVRPMARPFTEQGHKGWRVTWGALGALKMQILSLLGNLYEKWERFKP